MQIGYRISLSSDWLVEHTNQVNPPQKKVYTHPWYLSMCILHISPYIDTSDYTGGSLTFTFEPGDSEVCQNIELIDDDILEDVVESFELTLSVDNEPSVVVSPNQAEVLIFDDDGKLIMCDSVQCVTCESLDCKLERRTLHQFEL